jgi:hypothetical protein
MKRMTPGQKNANELVKKIKMNRTNPHILDMRDLSLVTTKDFWKRLDDLIDLNFRTKTNKEEILDDRLYIEMLFNGSKSKWGMGIEVYFDENEKIEIVRFDPPHNNSVEDDFMDRLGKSRMRKDIELSLM